MSNLVEHAAHELRLAGYDQKGGIYDGMLFDAILGLIKKFAEEGHSGMSAAITLRVFIELADFKPLMPLTGEDDEWDDTIDPALLQNKRCSRVFKDPATGQAYDSVGKKFVDAKGASFQTQDSHVDIEFPYIPKTEVVRVDEELKPLLLSIYEVDGCMVEALSPVDAIDRWRKYMDHEVGMFPEEIRHVVPIEHIVRAEF